MVNLGDEILSYMEKGSEHYTTKKDIVDEFKEKGHTIGSINAKMRTLESNDLIVKVGRGMYALNTNVKQKDLLLNKIKGFIDDFNIPPYKLNKNEKISEFYQVYDELTTIYENNTDEEMTDIENVLEGLLTTIYPSGCEDSETNMKAVGEIVNLEVKSGEQSIDSGKIEAYNLLMRSKIKGEDVEIESVEGFKYSKDRDELRKNIIENIQQSLETKGYCLY